jgi:hypothetical protein
MLPPSNRTVFGDVRLPLSKETIEQLSKLNIGVLYESSEDHDLVLTVTHATKRLRQTGESEYFVSGLALEKRMLRMVEAEGFKEWGVFAAVQKLPATPAELVAKVVFKQDYLIPLARMDLVPRPALRITPGHTYSEILDLLGLKKEELDRLIKNLAHTEGVFDVSIGSTPTHEVGVLVSVEKGVPDSRRLAEKLLEGVPHNIQTVRRK